MKLDVIVEMVRRPQRALVVAALCGVSAAAVAQPGTQAIPVEPVRTESQQNLNVQEQVNEIDTIEVTGSRILRDEFASSSPISSFNRADVDFAGTVSVDEFLKEVPAFTGYQQNTSTNNGSDGQKKVDLRGLGFNRLLVLINGRRQIGDVNGDGAVDLNTIPEALIERVEVLKDGASTVYGSDALSGVVNIILKKNFEGVELRSNYGLGTDDSLAENTGVSVLAGATGARGNIAMSFGYSQQKEMFQAERPFATSSLYPRLNAATGQFEARPSGSSNSRRIRVDTDNNGSFESNFIVDSGTGRARPFGPCDVYNFAPVNALITPNERYQISAIGNLDVTDDVGSYFEAMYTRRTSQQRLAPDASFAVRPDIETPNNGPQFNDFVPASNPFNPFGNNPRNDAGITGQNVRINRRFVESGGRLFVQGADTYRMVAGLKGEVLNTGISWDLSYTFAYNEVVNETKNYGRFDRWAIAVDPDACAADSACSAAGGVLNPFDDYGSISPSQMAYLTTGSLKDVATGELNLLQLNFSGQFAANLLPGGAIGWAAGVEKRKEQGVFSPDEFLSEGLTTGGANDPQSGAFVAKEIYGELLLPVLDNLNVDLSTRFSDYDSTGSSTTYKIGADYQPIDSLNIRGGISTGYRAPNITELNQGNTTTFPIVNPACEFGDRLLAAGQISQTAYDNCQALAASDGVDTTDSGEYGFAWQSAYTFLAPPKGSLKPEESTTYSLGAAYSPEFLKGLSVGIDYFNIEVENVIGTDDINDLTTACMNSAGFTAPACAVFSTGKPYDGPFPADVTQTFGNLGTIKTTGLDFNAYYESALGIERLSFINKFHLLWGATYLMSYERQYPLAGTRELAGTANGFAVFPEWRWNAEAGVAGDSWTAAWQVRFIGESDDALRPAAITDDAKAESVVYHDLVGSYSWRNISFYGGINNLTDVDPPRFHSAFNANTDPGTYDVIGRRLFTGVKVTF
jgi:iron complex outermembrane recepter protein